MDCSRAGLGSDQPARLEPQRYAPDDVEALRGNSYVLGGSVHVAKAALEVVRLEDRGRARDRVALALDQAKMQHRANGSGFEVGPFRQKAAASDLCAAGRTHSNTKLTPRALIESTDDGSPVSTPDHVGRLPCMRIEV